MPIITVEHLTKAFGRHVSLALEHMNRGDPPERVRIVTGCTVALCDVSFEVTPGNIFVIMGLSGSGKSTLLRSLNGLIRPSAGTVRIDGLDIGTARKDELLRLRRERVAMVFQRFALLPHRSVAENTALGLEIRGMPRRQRLAEAERWLELVGLGDWTNAQPDELSGGMMQRVGLARALATGAPILLMDEPFSALDPLIRRDMQDELLQLQQTVQRTMVFVTHDLSEALKLGDQIVVMRAGRIIQTGTAEEILSSPADDYIAAFTQDVDRSRVLTARSVMRPVQTIPLSGGPRSALRKMKELGLSTVFVTRRDGSLAGIVSVDEVLAAINQGEKTLEGCIETDVTTVSQDESLLSVARVCADRRAPAAILGDGGKLLGIVTRVDLLAALSGVNVRGDDGAVGDGVSAGRWI